MDIGVLLGNREAIPRVGDGVFSVAAVDLIAGEARLVAKIFLFGKTISTMAASRTQPGNAHPRADRDPQGYRVAVAHDLRAATTRLRNNGFGIVLVDVRLPDGGGRELLQTVRRLESDARTTLITGQRPNSGGTQSQDMPADAVCYKPFEVKELLALIEGFRPS